MSRLKYNSVKDTYALKGLSYAETVLIGALIWHTRLGAGDIFRDAAFSLANAFEETDLVDGDSDFDQVTVAWDTGESAIVVSENTYEDEVFPCPGTPQACRKGCGCQCDD